MIENNDVKNILGAVLKDLRSKKGITQEKLAEFLGIQAQSIAKIETGKRFVSSELLAKLCNFFNVEPHVFFLKRGRTYTPKELNYLLEINSKLDKIYEIVKK